MDIAINITNGAEVVPHTAKQVQWELETMNKFNLNHKQLKFRERPNFKLPEKLNNKGVFHLCCSIIRRAIKDKDKYFFHTNYGDMICYLAYTLPEIEVKKIK